MNKLKRARVLADMSQQQLSDMSGVSLYRIQVIERDWHQPRPDEVKVFAKVLNVKQNELTQKGEVK